MKFINSFLKFFLLLSLSVNLYGENIALENELKLKSVYLVRLSDFTTFPSKLESDRLNICVEGTSPIVSFLNEIELDEDKKYLTILYDISNDSISGCNILYLSENEKTTLSKKLKTLSNSEVLTISSMDGFALSGGMIEFYLEKNKVKMKVNLSTLRESGIFINPKVLKLMSIVKH